MTLWVIMSAGALIIQARKLVRNTALKRLWISMVINGFISQLDARQNRITASLPVCCNAVMKSTRLTAAVKKYTHT